ncbi:hypothetical protein RND71_030159 [Anisodus tanguticus]|uniref:Transposase MuDR plant domain-containing protein n=1 Tax=Anisodus tanguticus TaxID=243964 RepID=A0AAE1V589_9SOLA|nr:hypothetical protein RND71_030159 [Anisodus tanguticus]
MVESGLKFQNEFELWIDVTNIVHHSESYSIDVEAGTDCDCANEALNSSSNDSSDDDFDIDELEFIRLQNKREITLKLEHFKIIYPRMSFKDTLEARMFMNVYALAENKGLVLLKSDKSRVRYKCVEGYPFKFFECKRVDSNTIAYYFQKKLQNDPKVKVKEMRAELKVASNVNVSHQKCKRDKRMILEELSGSYNDEYNKL